MKRKNRITALFLVFALLLMLVPASVFADGKDLQTEGIAEDVLEIKETLTAAEEAAAETDETSTAAETDETSTADEEAAVLAAEPAETAALLETPHLMWAYDKKEDSFLHDEVSNSAGMSTSVVFFFGTHENRGPVLSLSSVTEPTGIMTPVLLGENETACIWVNMYFNQAGTSELTVTTKDGQVYSMPVRIDLPTMGFSTSATELTNETIISYGRPFDCDEGSEFYYICACSYLYIPRDAMDFKDPDKTNFSLESDCGDGISCELVEDGTKILNENTSNENIVENCYFKFTVDSTSISGDHQIYVEAPYASSNGYCGTWFRTGYLTATDKSHPMWSHSDGEHFYSTFDNSTGDCYPCLFYYGTEAHPGDPLNITSVSCSGDIVSVGGIASYGGHSGAYLYFDRPGEAVLTVTTAEGNVYEYPVTVDVNPTGFTSASSGVSAETLISHGVPFTYGENNAEFYFVMDDEWRYIPKKSMTALDDEGKTIFYYRVNGGDSDWVSCELIKDGTKEVQGRTVDNCYYKFTVNTEKAVGDFTVDLRCACYDFYDEEIFSTYDFAFLTDGLEHLYFSNWRDSTGADGTTRMELSVGGRTCGNFFIRSDGQKQKLTEITSITSSDEEIVCYDRADEDGDLWFSAHRCGDAELTVVSGGNTYTIPVHVSLPETGFFTGKTPSEDTLISNETGFQYTAGRKTFYYVCTNADSYIPQDALTRKDENGELLFAMYESCKDFVTCKLLRNGTRKLANGDTIDNYILEFTVDTRNAPGYFWSGFTGLAMDAPEQINYYNYGAQIEVISGIPSLYTRDVYYDGTVFMNEYYQSVLSEKQGYSSEYSFCYGLYDGEKDPLEVVSISSKNQNIASAERAVFYVYDKETAAEVDAYAAHSVWKIHFNTAGTTELTLKDARGKTYKLTVNVSLPESGFYKSGVRSGETLLEYNQVPYVPGGSEDIEFYYILDASDSYIGANGIAAEKMELWSDTGLGSPDFCEKYLRYELVSMEDPIRLRNGELADRYMIRFTVNPAFSYDADMNSEYQEFRYVFHESDIWGGNEDNKNGYYGSVCLSPHELCDRVWKLQVTLGNTLCSKDGKDIPIGSFWMKPSVYTALEKALGAAENVVENNRTMAAYDAALTALDKVLAKYDLSKEIKEGLAVPADWLEYYENPEHVIISDSDHPTISKSIGLKQKFSIPVRAVREDGTKPTEAIQWTVCEEEWCYSSYENYNPGCITLKNGVATGKTAGTVLISASLANGNDIWLIFTVEAYPTKIALSEKKAALAVGETVDVCVSVTPANATYAFDPDDFTYNENVFSIEQDEDDDKLFHITLLTTEGAKSKENITFKEHNSGKTAKLSISISSYANVINTTEKFEGEIPLVVGKNITLKATPAVEGSTIKATNAKNLRWTLVDVEGKETEDENVILTQSGKVTVNAIGTFYIRVEALANDNETATASRTFVIKADEQLKGLKIATSRATLTVGDNYDLAGQLRLTFSYKYTDPETVNVEYSYASADNGVAIVNEVGEITAVGTGVVKITVTAKYGTVTKTASLSLKVVEGAH